MTTGTSGGVDLDQVLVVADDLRRICNRAIRFGVTHSTFKQESWEAALAHVQDLKRGTPALHKQQWCVLSPSGLLSTSSVAVEAPGRPMMRWPPTERRGSAACWTWSARR